MDYLDKLEIITQGYLDDFKWVDQDMIDSFNVKVANGEEFTEKQIETINNIYGSVYAD